MIRVVLTAHLRMLAQLPDGEVELDLPESATQGAIIDALEVRFPPLRGTLRDYATQERRPYVRFFACGEDVSHEGMEAPLPEPVAKGKEPFLILGAMAGG